MSQSRANEKIVDCQAAGERTVLRLWILATRSSLLIYPRLLFAADHVSNVCVLCLVVASLQQEAMTPISHSGPLKQKIRRGLIESQNFQYTAPPSSMQFSALTLLQKLSSSYWLVIFSAIIWKKRAARGLL